MSDDSVSDKIYENAELAHKDKQRKVLEFSQYLFDELRDPNSKIYKTVIADSSQGFGNSCIERPNILDENRKRWKEITKMSSSFSYNPDLSNMINNNRPNDLKNLGFTFECASLACKVNIRWKIGKNYRCI